MTTQTKEPSKPRSAYVDEAIQLAVDGRWEEAVELNRYILATFGPDEATQNRLGKALTELGRLEEAKAAYDACLAINPLNLVARKNSSKLESLLNAKEALKGGAVKVDLNLFVEEMGKTTTTTLREVAEDVCSKVAPGDVAELRVNGDSIEVDTVRGVRVGSLEPKLARRLIKFIQGGNRYQAGITSCEGDTVRVIVREVYQDPRFAGKPSFPIVRRREEFRPYTRESLVAREAYEPVEEELEEEPVMAAGLDLDEDEEGMHEVGLEDVDADLDFGEDVGALDLEEEDEGEEPE
ncbi:MAG TPA: tetratricopeptide repeat protein [Candidatus Dormibacteraeota bacterium]|nr:tetratricopeptide repeat protein [Candidatus Dormibacteraeota bacterium]